MATGWALQRSVVMAKGKASRTNRVLALLVIVVLATTGAVAIFSDSLSDDASDPKRPATSVTSGVRPAETGRNIFSSDKGVEQYDFAMPRLSCVDISDEVTPDICGVATTSKGDFMLTGYEYYWDDSNEEVELGLTISVHRSDNNLPRAVGLLEGTMTRFLRDAQVQLTIYTTTINGDEVMVAHRRPVDSKLAGFSQPDQLFIIAMSPTGAPTVVAWYRGPNIRFESDGKNIFLYYKRYGVAGAGDNSGWDTEVRLSPSSRQVYSWDEQITTSLTSSHDLNDESRTENLTQIIRLDTFTFPAIGRFAPSRDSSLNA